MYFRVKSRRMKLRAVGIDMPVIHKFKQVIPSCELNLVACLRPTTVWHLPVGIFD
jgi:hypothetical protein